ncbi:MAG: trehalose-phosphatase [Acidimicrobiales bacterium]
MAHPSTTALITDFDGTLAPIVDDPAAARPVEGVPALLRRLAGVFAEVAVVSGRPAAFLREHLGAATGPGSEGTTGARLFGLYGMESVGPDGAVELDEAAAAWLPTVAEAAGRLRAGAPDGVLVEVKGAAVTVHWRRARGAEDWAWERVAGETARSGLVAHPGRLSVELRPPLAIDKGTVVRRLTEGCTAACFLGDDVGDLPAFVELGRRSTEDGLTTVGVAVIDDETSPEVVASADLSVAGPRRAVALLNWLADEASAGGTAS